MHCAHTVADLMSMAPRRQHPHRYLASCCIWHLFAHALSHFYSCLGYRVTRTTCCFKRVADLLFCLAFIFRFITVNVQGAIFSATDRRDDYLAVLLAERYVNAPLLRVRTFSRTSISVRHTCPNGWFLLEPGIWVRYKKDTAKKIRNGIGRF